MTIHFLIISSIRWKIRLWRLFLSKEILRLIHLETRRIRTLFRQYVPGAVRKILFIFPKKSNSSLNLEWTDRTFIIVFFSSWCEYSSSSTGAIASDTSSMSFGSISRSTRCIRCGTTDWSSDFEETFGFILGSLFYYWNDHWYWIESCCSFVFDWLMLFLGSGIFVSPKGVLRQTQSVGLCLIVWVGCGLISLLGTFYLPMIVVLFPCRSSLLCGNRYGYTKKWCWDRLFKRRYNLRSEEELYMTLSFSIGIGSVHKRVGDVLAYLLVWTTIFISKPSSIAVLTLTFSQYFLSGVMDGKIIPLQFDSIHLNSFRLWSSTRTG